jgi:hypothetical protein
MSDNFKEMTTKELTDYFLVNRQDMKALEELKTRKGDISIKISADVTQEEMYRSLKEGIQSMTN